MLQVVHLRPVSNFRFLHCTEPKIDYLDGVTARDPKHVRCSIFNEILPIRDWAFDGHLNNGHWLIPTQAWEISVKG